MTNYLIKFILVSLFLSFSASAQTGVFKSYYMNGQKSAEISYSDGIYDGTSIWYYENGNIKEIKTYSNGKVNGWCKTFYESGLLKEEKYVENGYINGILKRYYANGALQAILTYEKGRLVKSTYFDYDPYYQAPIEAYRAGNQQQVVEKKSEEFLCDVEICPLPLGGKDAIYRNLVYPADAKAYGLEGEVKLVATVNKDGKVTEVKVIKGIGLGCDEAAVEAVKKTRFLPGQNADGPTTSNVTFSIEFKLKEEETLAAEGKTLTAASKPQITYKEPDIGEYTKGEISNEQGIENESETPERIAQKKKDQEQNFEQRTVTGNRLPSKIENYFSCSGYDKCAQPEEGINAVLKNFKIPKRVKENNVKGNVVVLCEVDENGEVRKTTVIKTLPHGCGVAVEVALLATKFKPAIKDGKPVRSTVTVTVPVDY